ncbi:tape measure protein [Abyssicoccus albus]|uniref:tape measure protein n=1 Tax=Abyssicoccus albus TaxID=1817405 RepID=UPI00097E2DC9|nr:tape measure protein [Abyssicoccus albus]AQL56414.1 hypothetical protein BVH56_05510 [Abyssicoccus albus]
MSRIRGLSIDLTLNDASVTRSVSSIKDSFKDLQRSARVSLNNIKFDNSNLKSFKSNFDDLNKIYKNQEKNLNDLNKAYKKLEESGREGTQEGQRLRMEINKQANELNRMGDEVDEARSKLHQLYQQSSPFSKIGGTFQNMGSGLQSFGGQIQSIGTGLTQKITLPAFAAATAVGGLTAALGWKRLTGMDNARAKLKGMKYDAEEVETITADVQKGVRGGMMTMAEGVDTAAGALAAGIPQGKELQKYIKLVDAAAVGMNSSVTETSMIMNRVVGSGKLMTQELNMVEERMPGFSNTMAEHMGVSMEEFRKMVSAGQVSSEDFLTVMNDFAGGMADAHSKTFSGMVQNAKAWIGILGETMLQGAFEESKQSIKEFLDLLKSEQAQQYAKQLGVVISDVFGKLLTVVKDTVTWFINLDESKKKLIGTLTGVALAAGPLLTAFGGLILFFGKIISAIAPVFAGLGKLHGSFMAVKGGVLTFGAAFPKLASLIGVLSGPIGWIVGGIALLGTAFVTAYAKSETFRNFINNLRDKFIAFIPTIKSFSSQLYEKFMGMVIPAFNSVKKFGMEMFQKIKQFWKSDGEQTFLAFMNIVNLVKSAIEFAFPYIKKTIEVAMKLAFAVIKMVWENIKGVISGSLDIIMGLVRVFSGIFTGDFSKMWQGVKQIFSGAIKVIWNGFQLLFYGRIIKGVGSLVKIFSGSIKGLWTKVVGFFKGMYSGASRQVSNLFSKVMSIVRSLNSGFNRIVANMVASVLRFFRNLKSSGVSIVSNFKSTIQRLVTTLKTFFINSISRLKDGAIRGFSTLKSKATSLVSGLKDNTIKYLNKMVDGAKALPGRLGSAIKNGAHKAVSGIKSLGNKMAGSLGNVVNGVIKGLNSITSKIGISAKISEWTVPKFSRGTGQGSPTGKLTRNGKLAMDTIARVGDKGPGNGKGTRELVHYPNGQVGLYDNDATIYAPKGTTIFNNKETESLLNQIPKFSKGTGFSGTIKNLAGKAFDYISNPKALFNDLVSKVAAGLTNNLNGFMKNFAKGGFGAIKNHLLNWMKSRFSESSVGKKQKWMDYRITTPYSPHRDVPGYPTAFNGGRHFGIDYGTPVGVNITAPMAGKVTSQYNTGGGRVARLQSGKAAQYFMHMSSVKSGKVGIGDSLGRSGNTGAWTTGPHLHWQHEEPGSASVTNRNTKNPLKMVKKHLKGGFIKSQGLFELHPNEYVIPDPTQNPSEAMKIIALASKKLMGDSKQTKELPNVTTGDSAVVQKLTEQNGILIKMLEQLTGINAKEFGITDNDVGEANDRYTQRQSSKHRVMKGRVANV